jgi:TRAP-type C4-dicarboxylate transport system permease small subunit
MNKWVKEHGLLLANIGLFAVFFCGMIVSGANDYSEDQLAHGQPAVGIGGYLATGAFLEATFENWESEFLQMGMYVILTVFLFQKGSSESKPMGRQAPQDQDPRDATVKAATPWPVRRGGWVLKLYEHSLSILFLLLFLASFTLHAIGGSQDYSDEQLSHGQPAVTLIGYLATSRFWFESFQNWQSEFLAVAVLVGASVYLREKGSPESKPVAEAHYETGA